MNRAIQTERQLWVVLVDLGSIEPRLAVLCARAEAERLRATSLNGQLESGNGASQNPAPCTVTNSQAPASDKNSGPVNPPKLLAESLRQ